MPTNRQTDQLDPFADHVARCQASWQEYLRAKEIRRDDEVCVRSEIAGNVRFRRPDDATLIVEVVADNGETRSYRHPQGVDLRVGEGARVGVGDVLIQDFPARSFAGRRAVHGHGA